MSFAVDATCGSSTRSGSAFAFQSTVPRASVIRETGTGEVRSPPLASVPYADAISSVFTSFVPRTADRYGSSGCFGLLTSQQQHPHPLRALDDGLRSDPIDQLRIDRVHRMHRRRAQAHRAVAPTFGVRDIPDAAALERDCRLDGGRTSRTTTRRAPAPRPTRTA